MTRKLRGRGSMSHKHSPATVCDRREEIKALLWASLLVADFDEVLLNTAEQTY